MRNASWTEVEQMKTIWSIVNSELLTKTGPKTKTRKKIVDTIVTQLLEDPDFSERHKAKDPRGTVYQHIQAWIGYLEDRRKEKPLLVK